MSQRVKWIEYKGKKILTGIFSGLSGELYMKAIEELLDIGLTANEEKYYVYVDMSDTHSTSFITTNTEKILAKIKDKKFIAAVTGYTGIQKIVANALMGKLLYFAKSREEALEWLIKQ